MALFDFSNNIRTHAYFVGAIVTIDTIVTLLFSSIWDQLPVPPEHAELYKNARMGILYSGLMSAIFAIIYWVGFLKRIRFCITMCIVFVGLGFIIQAIGLVIFIISLNFASTMIMIVVCGINAYVLLVLIQLRRAMLDGTLPDGEHV
ncbi:uncharacterized protein LOC131294291 [Anopheles ziemanni]|uniref:uncharacterized protein LOC131294291 n=1 Tax=Anopheles ziemanni TaxID=345580 RepID=UPI0026604B92|nr:uncharacterized protein LOC131294291 [Anopheles ziemanni]